MPKWLSRILLVLLALVMLGGALYGAFRIGRYAGGNNEVIKTYQLTPRQDRDQIMPYFRQDNDKVLPQMPMTTRVFTNARFPIMGLLGMAVWGLARLGLLVLLIWVIVRLVLRSSSPAPAVLAPPAAPVAPVQSSAPETVEPSQS